MPTIRRTAIAAIAIAIAAAVLPAAAAAAPLNGVGVFVDATLLVKMVILGLVVSTAAAVVVCAIKLASGPRLSGGSAFLSGLRLGGPLAGLLGAAYTGLNMAIALANAPAPPPANVLAPGAAEVLMLILLGLVAGSVAVIANWAVEARIDRTVLGA
jgi:hypothetical protein